MRPRSAPASWIMSTPRSATTMTPRRSPGCCAGSMTGAPEATASGPCSPAVYPRPRSSPHSPAQRCPATSRAAGAEQVPGSGSGSRAVVPNPTRGVGAAGARRPQPGQPRGHQDLLRLPQLVDYGALPVPGPAAGPPAVPGPRPARRPARRAGSGSRLPVMAPDGSAGHRHLAKQQRVITRSAASTPRAEPQGRSVRKRPFMRRRPARPSDRRFPSQNSSKNCLEHQKL